MNNICKAACSTERPSTVSSIGALESSTVCSGEHHIRKVDFYAIFLSLTDLFINYIQLTLRLVQSSMWGVYLILVQPKVTKQEQHADVAISALHKEEKR